MSDPIYSDLEALLDVPFQFERRPDPVPASLRPERRIPLLLLLVAKSHGAGASWKGLQLLSWAVRSDANIDLIISLRTNNDLPDRALVRFEPALDRAIDLAVGLGLLEQKNKNVYKLTTTSKKVVSEIEKSDAFEVERARLDRLGGKVTQKEVARLLEWRRR
ncbi:hypothetical protein HFP15_28290 [Amycolatopsis sp. K13G38]|uniref:Uncharacterized protein n=1 Tax=Amycolatopsis acididurans TaxID=2724524 RepID=A0ABX1JAG4_9PSEU|nr:hypothetical protein [Amycolatopsis acididurans]NKQ56777.1 hypothetical protein [Amycolatopsis acididurans]